jgi:hypothetical protein
MMKFRGNPNLRAWVLVGKVTGIVVAIGDFCAIEALLRRIGKDRSGLDRYYIEPDEAY